MLDTAVVRSTSYVVIELKAVDFDPGFLGSARNVMAAVDDLLAHQDDKPTIGLLLCRSPTNREDTVGQTFEHDNAYGSGGVQGPKMIVDPEHHSSGLARGITPR